MNNAQPTFFNEEFEEYLTTTIKGVACIDFPNPRANSAFPTSGPMQVDPDDIIGRRVDDEAISLATQQLLRLAEEGSKGGLRPINVREVSLLVG